MGRTKARVNSKINNRKGAKNPNSLASKLKGNRSAKPKDSYGYCLLHSVYIGKKKFETKNCLECKHFVDLNGLKKEKKEGI